MSALEELLSEKREAKLDRIRNKYIKMGVTKAYMEEHPYDSSIFNYFRQKRLLTEAICIDNRWEPTYNGFVTRTNYRFDHVDGEIKYDTHRITKQGEEYVPDHTEEALVLFINNKGNLKALAKAEEKITKYYERYKEKVDDSLDIGMKYFSTFTPDLLEKKLPIAERDNNMFYELFGDIGIYFLIKWLNRLNAPYTIEKLVEEFIVDINKAQEFLEIREDPNYLRSKRCNIDFIKCFFRVLERYSPRGESLRKAYKKVLEEQKGLKK